MADAIFTRSGLSVRPWRGMTLTGSWPIRTSKTMGQVKRVVGYAWCSADGDATAARKETNELVAQSARYLQIANVTAVPFVSTFGDRSCISRPVASLACLDSQV